MGKVKYHVVVDQLTGALDSKKYGESHGMRMVSRYRKGSGDEHQIYFLRNISEGRDYFELLRTNKRFIN